MTETVAQLVHDMSSDMSTSENRQTLQIMNAYRGNGETRHDGATVPDEQQTELGSDSHELNLQANEEQRRDVTTPYNTITAQSNEPPQAFAAPEHPQPVDNRSPYPSILSELVRMQQELEVEVSKIYGEIRTLVMRQEQLAAGHTALRAQTLAQMQAVLAQFNQVQEAQRKSDERAQKTQDEIKKMKEEMKTREEEFNVKVEETIREKLRVAVDQEFEGMLRKEASKGDQKGNQK